MQYQRVQRDVSTRVRGTSTLDYNDAGNSVHIIKHKEMSPRANSYLVCLVDMTPSREIKGMGEMDGGFAAIHLPHPHRSSKALPSCRPELA